MKAKNIFLASTLLLANTALAMDEAVTNAAGQDKATEEERPLTPSRMYDGITDAYTGTVESNGQWMLEHWGEPYSGKTVHPKPSDDATTNWTAIGASLPTIADEARRIKLAEAFVTHLKSTSGVSLEAEAFKPALQILASRYKATEEEAIAAFKAAREQQEKEDAAHEAQLAAMQAEYEAQQKALRDKLKAKRAEQIKAYEEMKAKALAEREAQEAIEMKLLAQLAAATKKAGSAAGETVATMKEVDLTPSLYTEALTRMAGYSGTMSRKDRRKLQRDTDKSLKRGQAATKGGKGGRRRRR